MNNASAVIRTDAGIQIAIQPSLIVESSSATGLDGRMIWYIQSIGGDTFFEIDAQNISSISFPVLEGITGAGSVVFYTLPNLTEILFPELQSVDSVATAFQFTTSPQLTKVSLPKLTTLNSTIKITVAQNLSLLSLPSLTSIGNGAQLHFIDNALDVTSVNNLLIQVNSARQGTGVLRLDGGTSAAPTGAGIVAKNALTDAGWTAATN